MMPPPALIGPGYAVHLPAGFQVLHYEPAIGAYWLLPPGSDPTTVPALLQVRYVQPTDLPMLLQNVDGMDNPMVAMSNATNLGLALVSAVAPVRRESMAQGMAHIREFDALTINNYPVRVMVIVIQGTLVAVELIVMMNLQRWVEFIGPCLGFVAALSLAGGSPSSGQVRAIVDQSHREQVEFQIVNPEGGATPMTALPTSVGGITIINVDNSVRTGDIHGTGVVVGHHSTATVS